MDKKTDEPTSADGAGPTTGSRSRGATNRRAFMQATGATALAAGGIALGSSSVAASQYDETVNIVDDYGADPTGEESVVDPLHEAMADDTEIVFPEGTYTFDEQVWQVNFGSGRQNNPRTNMALVGEGDVTLVPPDSHGAAEFDLMLTFWGGDGGIRLENFTIDMTAPGVASGISVQTPDDLVVRDLTFEGAADNQTEEGEPGPHKLYPAVTSEDGSGVIENVTATDGASAGPAKHGVYVYPQHAGELVVSDSAFAGLTGHAIYTSEVANPEDANFVGQRGSVGVENCAFLNNNASAVDLASPGSYARDCTVIFDRDGDVPALDGSVHGRTAYLERDFEGSLENVQALSFDGDAGATVYCDRSLGDGAIDVSNCGVTVAADETRAFDFAFGDGDVSLQDVTVTGDASGGPAISVASRSVDASGLCIDQSGDDRDGVELIAGATGSISDSTIAVTGEAISVDDDSEADTSGIEEEGGCSRPEPLHEFEGADVPTPSPTPTATSTATATDGEETPTPTSTGGPGFGVLAAVGAAGAATLAALRRTDDE